MEITEPPSNLPPGIVGTLIDERADMRDIISTLVDLAKRGFLDIREIDKSDFTFTRTDKSERLKKYERYFYQRIFRGKSESTDLSSLRYKFHSAIPHIQKLMYDELVRLEYFPAPPQSIRNRFAAFGINRGAVTPVPLDEIIQLSFTL